MKILVIEDDHDIQNLVKRHLENDKPEIESIVKQAFNMKEGECLIESFSPDVIVLDLNLPDSRGKATMERTINKSKATPVIVLTGDDDPKTVKQCLESGASDFVCKNEEMQHIKSFSIHAFEDRKKRVRLACRLAGERLGLASQQIGDMISPQ